MSVALILDAGNTALKWFLVPLEACASADPFPLLAENSLPWTHPQFEQLLSSALQTWRQRLVGIWGCTVTTPAQVSSIDNLLQTLTGFTPVWFAAQAQFQSAQIQLTNAYTLPHKLGADRWHALLGARCCMPHQPVLVVCAGTATTVDTLQADGHFAGGIIAPGVALMHDSLSQNTAQLPPEIGVYQAFPTQTSHAIRTGILDAQAGLILHRHRVTQMHLKEPIAVRITGGNAAILLKVVKEAAPELDILADPYLIARGIWQRVRARPEHSAS